MWDALTQHHEAVKDRPLMALFDDPTRAEAFSTRLGDLLDRIAAPVSVHVGAEDSVTPPPMARWLGTRLGVQPRVHAGIGHELAIRLWTDLLREAAGT